MAANRGELSCSSCKKPQAEVPETLKRCAKCQKVLYCSKECQRTDWSSHKLVCLSKADEEAASAGNYVLKVQLKPEDIKNPAIWRTLSCPAVATFERLHRALQIAFGWATTHTYDFKARDPDYDPADEDEEDMATMIMRLTETYNRSQQSQSAPRQNLLRIIAKSQDQMGGFGAVDSMHSGMRSHPRTPEKVSDKLKLYEVLEHADYRGNSLEYEYDFGDCWTHAITVTGRTRRSNTFSCTDGGGHPCAEDAGGVHGWTKLVEAYKAARPTEEQREKRKWFETMCSNLDRGGLAGAKLEQWDKTLVNRLLARV
jgi:Plasmid pRiA4b ORF-3-like protein/MYND finger